MIQAPSRRRTGGASRRRAAPARALLAAALLAALLRPAGSSAGEVPSPVFWGTPADFVRQVGSGQFDPHLELHLVEYSADPRWAAGWAAARWSGSGLLGQYGSTTARTLFVDSQIAVNLFPTSSLQFRYERTDLDDGRFAFADQLLSFLWYPSSGWALVLSGWPTSLKEQAELGIGVRLGAPKAASSLVIRVVDEAIFWNDKSDGSLRYERDPVRLLAEGFVEEGRWRAWGSVDYGLEYEAVEPAPPVGGGRSTRGFQRYANVAAERRIDGGALSARLTAASLSRSQSDPAAGAAGDSSLEREWGRLLLGWRRDADPWRVYATGGCAVQRDRFASPGVPEGSYRMDALLLGAEVGRAFAPGLEVRLGYLGGPQDARRSGDPAGPLPPSEEAGYVDKAHLRVLYDFASWFSMEALVSQTLAGSSFGGGSVKGRLVF